MTARWLIEHGEDNPDLTPEEQANVRAQDEERLKWMTFYARSRRCLRGDILRYFGERAPERCGNCSNCVISVGPTTSMRMERFEYEFIEKTGVRIIIGKGGMKEKTAAACKAFGAIHCVLPAGNAVVGASCVEEITAVHWLDLGAPEAVWCCRVKEFGPLIVTIDQTGRNYFEENRAEYERRKEEQVEEISRQVHFMK